ncbi:MAG: SCO family protein [Myxococcota bacterium]
MRSAILALFAIAIVGCQGAPPPVMATIPVFSLTTPDGKSFKSDALVGQPYVASFFFTSCQTICPIVMNGVRGTLSKADDAGIALRAISITVDPDNDTPERLANYQTKESLNADRWTLLTGTKAELETVVVKGFMAYMGTREELEGDLFDIGHEARLMLIDPLGRLRGLFESDEAGQAALVAAAKRL